MTHARHGNYFAHPRICTSTCCTRPPEKNLGFNWENSRSQGGQCSPFAGIPRRGCSRIPRGTVFRRKPICRIMSVISDPDSQPKRNSILRLEIAMILYRPSAEEARRSRTTTAAIDRWSAGDEHRRRAVSTKEGVCVCTLNTLCLMRSMGCARGTTIRSAYNATRATCAATCCLWDGASAQATTFKAAITLLHHLQGHPTPTSASSVWKS